MKKEFYLLKVLTPLHIGAGQGLGHVDLPIVREVYTNFPYLPGTSIKGVLRNLEINKVAMKRKEKPSQIEDKLSKGKFDSETDKDIASLAQIFGTAGEAVEEGKEVGGAGKVLFSDAFILLFPVKSAKGVFSLTTCPYVINRFFELLGKEERIKDVAEDKAKVLSIKDHKNLINGKLLLEEFVFEAEEAKEEKGLRKFIEFVGEFVGEENKKRIVCVGDTEFKDFVSNYTEVQTRIKINPDTGTVSETGLWTEEYIPSESFFFFSLIFLENNINYEPPKTFHLGGDITTGKGFVKVHKLGVNHEK
jgi:CRISPR-associated protein Cmr4